MEVITIGHTSIDRVKAGDIERTQLGGASIYSAMAAKIFSKTGIVSRIGEDFPAEFYALLRDSGIDTGGIKKVRGKSTFFSIEYNKDGAASYSSYALNVGIRIRPEDIPKRYLNAKAFHIAPMAASKQKAFLKFLREKSYALISLNTHAGYFLKYKKDIIDLISEVDIFTINDNEAMQLTNARSFEHALNLLKKIEHSLIVVTMGIHGSVTIEKGSATLLPPPYQPKIIDLTGCGDAFTGSFLAGYLKTQNALKAASIANGVASIVSTDWNFQAVKNLKFNSIGHFQEFIISRQRKLSKNQKLLEYF